MSAPKVGFVSLGCPKALVDSERILTQLKIDGYQITNSYEDASIVVVNTCGFIDSAVAESLEAIGEAIEENGKVIVTGCLGVRSDEIRAEHPEVLSVSGPQQYEQVVSAVHQYAPHERKHDPYVDLVPAQGIRLTPRHYAYLKISEGCNHKCSFCIIPTMRGKLVSRDIDDVMTEAVSLVGAGVKELLIVSQDTGAYGTDSKYRTGFWRGRVVKSDLLHLAEALGELGIWIRLHYVYPYPHVDNIIPLMREGRILPYLDVPFQHGSSEVLKRMRRPAATGDNLRRIEKWRKICPEITIRSTFIVGFPGESEQEYEELLEFLRQARLDRVGCFKYSAVAGARANDLLNPVPEEIKQHRWEKFMALQTEISREKLTEKKDAILEVLVDTVDGEKVTGRSYADAPEIDGKVFARGGRDLTPGDVVRVKVDRTGDYDIWGTCV